MEEVIKLDEIDKYNKLFGLETRHPLVSVVDLSKATSGSSSPNAVLFPVKPIRIRQLQSL